MRKKNINHTPYSAPWGVLLVNLAFVFSIVFLISFLFWLVIICLNNGTHVNTFAADGTFQLYNPMRRLFGGQIIGKDFPFFHGIGIPLLHYPLFVLLGHGVFAAEVTKWIVSPLFFLASSYILMYAFFRDHKKATIAVGTLTIISLNWVDVIWPGNSLLGLRGTFPILIAAALLWKTTKKVSFKKFSIELNNAIALTLLGLSLLFSTEQGIAAVLAYASVGLLFIVLKPRNTWLHSTWKLFLHGVYIIGIALLAFTIVTQGHPFDALRYAFIDVPSDQGWYFGSDITGYLTWANLLPRLFDFSLRYMWAVILLGLTSLYLTWSRILDSRQKLGLIYCVIYGSIAFIITISGYYSPGTQLVPFERVMSIIFVIALVSFAFIINSRQLPKTTNLQRLAAISGFVLLFVVLPLQYSVTKIATTFNSFDIIQELRLAKRARSADDYFAASDGWKQSIDKFRPYIKPGDKIWSFYTGIYDSYFGNQLGQSSGGEDYIIHALGDTRRANYEKEFIDSKSKFVITLKPSYFDFEEWLWHNHWKMYEYLVTNYTLREENASSYLWELNASQPVIEHRTSSQEKLISPLDLPPNNSSETIVYVVTINYQTHSSVAALSRISRYMVDIQTSKKPQGLQVSLPSNKTIWSFPVISVPGEGTVPLQAFADGIDPGATLTISKASYHILQLNPENIRPFNNSVCAVNAKQVNSALKIDKCN